MPEMPDGKNSKVVQLYTLKEAEKVLKKRKREKINDMLYYFRQKVVAIVTVFVGLMIPFLNNGDATFSLLVIPCGVFLFVTKQKMI